MAKFHFQVRTPTHLLLVDSADLPDITQARVEAARRVGVLLTTHAESLWVDQDWHMNVTDAVGLILFSISVAATRTSATMDIPRPFQR